MKPYLRKQLDVYCEIIDTAARLATEMEPKEERRQSLPELEGPDQLIFESVEGDCCEARISHARPSAMDRISSRDGIALWSMSTEKATLSSAFSTSMSLLMLTSTRDRVSDTGRRVKDRT